MKAWIRWIFIGVRAAFRFLFVDIDGKDYLKAKWEPSSERWTHFSYGPEVDPDGQFDDSWRGENVAGAAVPFLFIVGVLLSPVWVPFLLWEASEGWRTRFLKWIGEIE